MDQVSRLQEREGIQPSAGTSSVSLNRPGFLQDSLKRSVDLPAYLNWHTLSSEVSLRLRY